MLTKEYLNNLMNATHKRKPKNPFIEEEEVNEDGGEGMSPYKVLRNIFSLISVFLSLFLVVTIHTAKGNWVLTICLGIALAIIAIYNELQKDKNLDILFQSDRLGKELLDKEEKKYNRRKSKKAQPIAIATVVLSILITGSAIFMYVLGDENDKIAHFEQIAQAKSDSVANYYAEKIDSLNYLSTNENINKYVDDYTVRLKERIQKAESQIEQTRVAFDKVAYRNRNQVDFNNTISELNNDIDELEEKIEQVKNDRQKELKTNIKSLEDESSKMSAQAYKSVMSNYEKQTRGEGFIQFIMGGATIIVESLIVLFSMLLAKVKTQFIIDKDRFDHYIKSLDDFNELKTWLGAVEHLYTEVGYNSSFSVKQRQDTIAKFFGGRVSENKFASILKQASIIQGGARKLVISEEEAKNNIMEIYLEKIRTQV